MQTKHLVQSTDLHQLEVMAVLTIFPLLGVLHKARGAASQQI